MGFHPHHGGPGLAAIRAGVGSASVDKPGGGTGDDAPAIAPPAITAGNVTVPSVVPIENTFGLHGVRIGDRVMMRHEWKTVAAFKARMGLDVCHTTLGNGVTT
jgi:hypothetical protein